jgi:beta-lactamase regulating signal transducer with metallopeptidase domain
MIPMNTEFHAWCARVVGSLLNGMYQGILLWLAMVLLFRWWTRSNAATRHAAWFSVLLLVAFLIPAHYFLDGHEPYSRGAGEPRQTPASFTQAEANPPSPPTLEPDAAFEATPSDLDPFGIDQTEIASADPFPALVELKAYPAVDVTQRRAAAAATAAPRVQVWQERLSSLVGKCFSPISVTAESAFNSRIITGLGLLWLTIALIRLMWVGFRLRQLKTMVHRASSPVPPAASELFESLVSELNFRRGVRLRVSSEQRSAIFVGLLQLVILLPDETAGDLAEAEPVLRHELAHLARYDDWTNLIQHLVQAIFFFHPAVQWIGKRLALEREVACDDHVLQLGSGRRDYAMILANVASRVQQRTPLLAPGVSHNHSQLQQRISMILNTRRNSSPNLAKAGLASAVSLAVVAASLGVYFAPRLVLAAAPASAAPPLRNDTAILTAAGAPEVSAAEPAELAGVGASITAQSEAPAGEGAGIEPGPKFKPDAPATEPPEPSEAVPGQVPEPPSIDRAPRPPAFPRAARVGKPGRIASSEDSIDPADTGNTSVEERLRRLEKMVRSLMDSQNGKRAHATFNFKDGANQNWNIDQEPADKLKDLADRQSARALEQAQRAVEQANRAKKDFAAHRDQQGQDKGEMREALQKQVEALRQAREGLGREMERLDRQIQKLQQEQERGDRDSTRRHGAASNNKLHAQISDDPNVTVNADADVSVSREVSVNTEVRK